VADFVAGGIDEVAGVYFGAADVGAVGDGDLYAVRAGDKEDAGCVAAGQLQRVTVCDGGGPDRLGPQTGGGGGDECERPDGQGTASPGD